MPEPRELGPQSPQTATRGEEARGLSDVHQHTWPFVERRRPGRTDFTNPHVIALLRGTRAANVVARPDAREPLVDDLKPVRGLVLAGLLAFILWAAAGALVWFVIRLAL